MQNPKKQTTLNISVTAPKKLGMGQWFINTPASWDTAPPTAWD